MTRSSEYALRALIFLAQNKDRWPIPGREISRATQVPSRYLQKILGDLTRTEILDSTPGRAGGFRLRRPAERIRLVAVIAPFERSQERRCPFGNTVCSDQNPCGAHEQWKQVVETERRFLREMTVGRVAQATRRASVS